MRFPSACVGLRPNVVVLNSLARAAALAQELGKAHSFLNDITHFGLEPDEATSAVLLRISSAERRLKKGPADVSDAMASTHASTSINASYTVK